jgi:hypothetical protein
MLRPATARLLTVTPVWNRAPNWLPHPTGQVALGLAIVESPASQTVGPVAATAAAGLDAAQAGVEAAAEAPTSSGTKSTVAASQRIMIASQASDREPRGDDSDDCQCIR